MREKLKELGYKTFIEDNTLYIDADPKERKKIAKIMKDYNKSYGIRRMK